MTPIQEIEFYADRGVRIQLELINSATKCFSIQILIYDPNFSPCYLLPIVVPGQYDNAGKAFEEGINKILQYMQTNGLKITRVNNPCNCEFLSRSDQQQIIDQHFNINCKIIVEVNGQH